MSINEIALPLLLTTFAGLSTVLGSLLLFSLKSFNRSYLNFFMGLSAGVMIYLSFMELLPHAITTIGPVNTNLLFFTGIIMAGSIGMFLPHTNFMSKLCVANKGHKKIFATGIATAVILALHNIPEGIAVFISSATDIRFGVFIALAITLHNIPEGFAIAAPIYYATRSKRKAFLYSFLAGVVEPLGGLTAYLLIKPFFSIELISVIFALVAGFMVYISFDELLPICFKNSGKHLPIVGVIVGMFVASLSIILLR